MENKREVIKLAVDLCKGEVNSEFAKGSVSEQMEVLRKELVKANGGSDKLNYKSMRNNHGLFAVIEEILEINDVQGWEGNDFFEQFVEYKNIALGDENSFYIEDNSLFTINTLAEGINGTLRQRINKGESKTIPTSLRAIGAYEELNRLLAGRINIIEFVEKIKKSFEENRAQAIYTSFAGAVEAIPAPFKVIGSADEEKILDVILHVEAATGGEAILLGTKKALAGIPNADPSPWAKERKEQLGFYGVFHGTPMLEMPQSHVRGSKEYDFAVSDKDVWVVTANDRPIKFVTEGDALFEQGNATDNADFTVDILAAERWGVAVSLDQMMGHIVIA